MTELLWCLVARVAAHPRVVDWLIARAKRTPYHHITSADGRDVYMERYWLFNPYPHRSSESMRGWRRLLPSARIHWIRREDRDRHMHDHPWNARTVILRGSYIEERREVHEGERLDSYRVVRSLRKPGCTARLRFGEYHKITWVAPPSMRWEPEGGAWTLFITWRYRGTWGYLVDGVKVPWRRYLGLEEKL
jgi:hypothetical protein